MTRSEFVDQLKRHEGYKERIYKDSVGVLTAGWGHAFLEGSLVPRQACEMLFAHDLAVATGAYEALELGVDPDDSVRRYAFINMIFNLGIFKFKGFKKAIAAARQKNWETCADEMLDSRWARQVGHRDIELANMIRTGKL